MGGIHELFLFELAVALVGWLLLLALEFAEQRLQAGTKVHKIYFTNPKWSDHNSRVAYTAYVGCNNILGVSAGWDYAP